MSGPDAARVVWGLAAVLLVSLGLELAWPDTAAETAPIAGGSPTTPVAGASADPVSAWTAVIAARPLFNPDRRPSAAAMSAAEPAQPNDLPRLAGILVLPGGSQAIFAPAGEASRSIVATEGAMVGGWKVVAIGAQAVQLAGPDGTRLVRPSYANTPPPPPPQPQSKPRPPAADVLLPPAPTDTRPFDSVVQPSGTAIFSHVATPAARSP